MKKLLCLLTTTIVLGLGALAAHATTNYWDSNGPIVGAGDTPNGTWDADMFWSPSSDGTSSATNTWVDGGLDGSWVVFSAGTDATNAYAVNIAATLVNPLGMILEDGNPTIAGLGICLTNEFLFPIVAKTNATISAPLSTLFSTCGFVKSGPGKLTLAGTGSAYGSAGTNIISEGIVGMATQEALGYSDPASPTIVSNGAALEVGWSTASSAGETSYLYGTGVANGGALYATAAPGGAPGWNKEVILFSDSRINWNGAGQWTFTGTAFIDGTNGGNNFSITFGGTGGTLRLNVGARYNRVLNLGTGSVTKDGSMQLRLENAAVFTGGFYFNAGKLAVRYPMFGQGPGGVGLGTIYVAAAAQEFNNPNATPNIGSPIILAAGANPTFNVIAANQTITCSGVISGLGGLSKSGPGALFLTAANTYSNNTTIRTNVLTLGGTGSISNSPVIDVQAGGIFVVTNASATAWVLQPGQTLKGNGGVLGDVFAAGTLAPGASVGTLTFSNNLAIAGDLSIEVDRSLAQSNDVVMVMGLLTNAGVGQINVSNIGGTAFRTNDTFQLFNQTLLNGQAMSVVSAGNVVWTNETPWTGSIRVLSAPAPVPATNLTVVATGPNSRQLGGRGAGNSFYAVYAAPNMTLPVVWTLIGNTISDSSGFITFVDTNATLSQRYYRFGQ